MIDWTKLLGGMGGYDKAMRIPGPLGNTQPMAQQQAAGQKTPWLNREGMGGLSKGELLMAGMGMLSGRNLQEGFGNSAQIAYGGMERKRKEQEKQEKSAALAKAMGMMQSGDAPGAKVALAGLYPDAVGGAMADQAFAGPQKPMVVNGRVVDPNDPSKVIADYSTEQRPAPGMVQDETGNWIYDTDYLDGQKTIAELRGGNQSQNVQGQFVTEDGFLGYLRRDGTEVISKTRVRNPYQIVDVGGVATAVDRQTAQGRPITTPEEVGTNAATIETIKGNEGARQEAQQGLPLAIEKADRSIATIESLVNHPGFDQAYGLASYVPAIRGTDRAGADALREQIGGQAFLEAFQSLKGGGQITEIEGQKATAAITRLSNPGISPAEARKAAQEFTEIIRHGTERAKATASGSYAPQGADAPALKYNPETGEFE